MPSVSVIVPPVPDFSGCPASYERILDNNPHVVGVKTNIGKKFALIFISSSLFLVPTLINVHRCAEVN